MKKLFNPHNHPRGLRIFLKKMCRMVGANYRKIDFKKDNWYLKYEWGKEQEEKFIQWGIKKLKKSKAIRKDIMLFPLLNDENSIKKTMLWFNMVYGWKGKNE